MLGGIEDQVNAERIGVFDVNAHAAISPRQTAASIHRGFC